LTSRPLYSPQWLVVGDWRVGKRSEMGFAPFGDKLLDSPVDQRIIEAWIRLSR
jgi:hypothetical protein